MHTRFPLIVTGAAAALLLTACGATPSERVATGALGGAAVGAVGGLAVDAAQKDRGH